MQSRGWAGSDARWWMDVYRCGPSGWIVRLRWTQMEGWMGSEGFVLLFRAFTCKWKERGESRRPGHSAVLTPNCGSCFARKFCQQSQALAGGLCFSMLEVPFTVRLGPPLGQLLGLRGGTGAYSVPGSAVLWCYRRCLLSRLFANFLLAGPSRSNTRLHQTARSVFLGKSGRTN